MLLKILCATTTDGTTDRCSYCDVTHWLVKPHFEALSWLWLLHWSKMFKIHLLISSEISDSTHKLMVKVRTVFPQTLGLECFCFLFLIKKNVASFHFHTAWLHFSDLKSEALWGHIHLVWTVWLQLSPSSEGLPTSVLSALHPCISYLNPILEKVLAFSWFLFCLFVTL